jgi:hypothetical protein
MWINVYERYRSDFDYYICIEDDYFPVLSNFSTVLVHLHNHLLPNGGYLNSLTTKEHAAVSNGIIDSKTFGWALDRVTNPRQFMIQHGIPQIAFSYLFAPKLADYLDSYRTLFLRFEGQQLNEEVHDQYKNLKQDLFAPIEYLVQGEQAYPKCGWEKQVWDTAKLAHINKIISSFNKQNPK